MTRSKKPAGPKSVETYRHDEKTTNIPARELRGLVEGDELMPAKMLYPRDTWEIGIHDVSRGGLLGAVIGGMT